MSRPDIPIDQLANILAKRNSQRAGPFTRAALKFGIETNLSACHHDVYIIASADLEVSLRGGVSKITIRMTEQEDPNAGFGDARKLEDIKFTQWLNAASEKRQEELRACERTMAARGLSQSGPRLVAEIEIIFSGIGSVIDQAVAYRKELGARVPALLTAGNLKVFQDKLNQYIDGGVNGVKQRSTIQPRGAGGPVLVQIADQKAYSLKARLNQTLAALPLEVRLGMTPSGQPNMANIHISNNTIANLNLGSIIGDLNGSIHQLNTTGHDELAGKLGKLTEGIADCSDLNDGTRKEMLEHLAVVSEEAAKPMEKRKMGPLKTSLEAIKSGAAVGTQLLTLFQSAEHALRAAGIIHP